MKVLCITDKQYRQSDNQILAIFEKYLLEYAKVEVVYFHRDSKALQKDSHIILPYGAKK